LGLLQAFCCGLIWRAVMVKTARCACGEFRVIVTGDPVHVTICHCRDCQRRSGVPWTCNAHYARSDVRLEGAHKIYTRDGQEGRKMVNHFCPECGTTVCWMGERFPDLCGVTTGTFNDPAYPAPSVSVYEEAMYDWVVLPPGMQHFPKGRPANWTPPQKVEE
jgi:hypothetical protein